MWHVWKIDYERKGIFCVRCGGEKWKDEDRSCPMGESGSRKVSLDLAMKIINGEI